MKIVGIVTEYNPFHLGHQHQMEAIKASLRENCSFVCCMSGNFVQRGEPALIDKWKRTELALRCGADLVIELPTPWAASTAQRFARGAVSLLNATGVVEVIAFGSESADQAALETAAACIDTPLFRQTLRTELNQGAPFAQARQAAVRACVGEDAAACLDRPNDSLAVEYLSALRYLQGSMRPLAILRQGAAHDGAPKGGTASASAIRSLIRQGDWKQAEQFLPEACREPLRQAPLSDMERCSRAVLYRLRSMEEAEFRALPDCGEGLHRRLMAAAREGDSLQAVVALAKTKRYTEARIRRAILWAYLGLRTEEQPVLPPYIKVLGFRETGRDLLRRMKQTASLPVLTKPAHGLRWAGAEGTVLRQEARCTDLFDLTLPALPPCGREWRESPVCLLDGRSI